MGGVVISGSSGSGGCRSRYSPFVCWGVDVDEIGIRTRCVLGIVAGTTR